MERDLKFDYMMLDRMRSDCEYYLGYGNRCDKYLYGRSAKEHIEKMKKLYNSFNKDEKPEWLTMEKINEYEEKMIDEIDENYLDVKVDGSVGVSINTGTMLALNVLQPKDCPFDEYTLFDLLKDLIKMYNWKVKGKCKLSEFVKLLQKDGIEKAIVYGDTIIEVLEFDFDEL